MSSDLPTNGRVGNRGRTSSVAVVGGGVGGVGAAVMLHRAGYDDVTVFERAERVGGVWNDNTYPGAACDVPSHLYEFSFEPNPRWSRRYAPQAEIQAYLEDVARRHGVLDRIRTSTEVKRAHWEERRNRWVLETSAGTHEADILITACGQLSVAKVPPIPGLASFDGPTFHTSQWRHDVELAGKRVAVIGTGCSAIQAVPAIQPIVAQIDVYQRSPGWTIPKMDFAYNERTQQLLERFPILQRLDRAAIFAFMELGVLAMTNHRWLLAPFRALARRQITKAIDDEELRAKVTPSDEVGCKRLMLTDEWYPTLTRPNVELVTDRIAEVAPSGIRLEDGTERPADVLVLATGFQTHGFVAPMKIVGLDGRTLADEWAEVPHAYLGMSVPGFPNMFLLYGPNTNGGTGSVIYVIEAGHLYTIGAPRLGRCTRRRRAHLRTRAGSCRAGPDRSTGGADHRIGDCIDNRPRSALMHFTDQKTFPDIGDGLWWGYKLSRRSATGTSCQRARRERLVAALVTLVGISFLAVITAAIASEFMSPLGAAWKAAVPRRSPRGSIRSVRVWTGSKLGSGTSAGITVMRRTDTA